MLFQITILFGLLLISPSYGSGNNNKIDVSVNPAKPKTSEANYVKMVQQEYVKSTNEEITKQITKELQASYIYQAYASYFQRADVSLPGIQKFFAAAALEEREHAQMLIEYINQRGGHVMFDKIDLQAACTTVLDSAESMQFLGYKQQFRMCICNFVTPQDLAVGKNVSCGNHDDWKHGLIAFEDALVTERYVNAQLLELHQLTDGDVHLGHLLEHHFLEEQVEAIYKLGTYVTRLTSFAKSGNYRLGEYMFDLDLQKSGAAH